MNAAAPRTRPVRVVIVDDTSDLRELLRLRRRGGWGSLARPATPCRVEAVRLQHPDVVLLDLSTPLMDGLEALPRTQPGPDAKIIVLSGFGATQMSERALAIGADGYLQKGMSPKRTLVYARELVQDPRPDSPTGALCF